jgi:peptide subunit release factor RF-3
MPFAEKRNSRHLLSGDIVGLHDTGNFKIGDTLTEDEIMNKRYSKFLQNISDTSIMLTYEISSLTKVLTN